MKMPQTVMATAVAGVLTLGVAAPVHADVYAGSQLLFNNLLLNIVPAGSVTIGSFTFNTNATAVLGVNTQDDPQECIGAAGCATIAPSPVLTSVANADAGSTVQRAAGNFTLLGPAASTTAYSNAASEVTTAQLVTGGTTNTGSVSEVNITGSGSGSAETIVASDTQISFDFTVTGDSATITLTFNATMFQQVNLDTPNATEWNASTNTSANFNLNGLTTASTVVNATWAPSGDGMRNLLPSGCQGLAAGSCVVNADPFDLNTGQSLVANLNPQNFTIGPGTGFYSLTISNIQAGNYNLNLASETFARANQTVQAVPEPSVLSLVGLGLVGLGFVARRRRIQG